MQFTDPYKSIEVGIKLGKLTTGLIFVLFDIQVNVNGHGIGLMPAFAGYFAIVVPVEYFYNTVGFAVI